MRRRARCIQGPVAGFCGHGTEYPGPAQFRENVDWVLLRGDLRSSGLLGSADR